MERRVIESFFANVGEYVNFLWNRNEQRKTVPDFTCLAILAREGNVFKYTIELRDPLSPTRSRGWMSEYVRPFKPDQANLDLFNAGCAECARRLLAYLATGEMDEGLPHAFGALGCGAPDETSPPLPPPARRSSAKAPGEVPGAEAVLGRTRGRYFPTVLEARRAKRYMAGRFEVLLLTDVICAGMVQSSHLLVASDKDRNWVYVIAAEFNDLYLIQKGSGTHFLCLYDGTGHSNLGGSDRWGDISEFERKACELMSERLGTRIVAL